MKVSFTYLPPNSLMWWKSEFIWNTWKKKHWNILIYFTDLSQNYCLYTELSYYYTLAPLEIPTQQWRVALKIIIVTTKNNFEYFPLFNYIENYIPMFFFFLKIYAFRYMLLHAYITGTILKNCNIPPYHTILIYSHA